ncbi:serine protease FAM111A-like [Cololabis saira]|uniref:serine protease FAM111A-like n=1 Tax=Cololabis saira TaxID=129043 RepID=UPI002AD4AD12|nr:serine protease FAM111A-like [Cololabis saira]XP_061595684.1 serine protease FAM111A-like [Cololabis saira]
MMAKNEGQVQNILKEKLDNQNGNNAQHPNSDDKENDTHPTHSFEWRCGENSSKITCTKAGTVLDSLKKSPQFNEIATKYNKKELLIMKEGKAVSSHLPCTLITQGERLTVKYIKAPKKIIPPVSLRKKTCGELVMFHVLTKGGKNVTKIMRNPELSKVVQEVTVYAYKGERVKDALRRDGRFQRVIFQKNCVLSQKVDEVITEFSNPVDDLHGTVFQIIMLNKSKPPDSLPGSLEEAYYYLSQTDSEKAGTHKKTPDQVLEEIHGSKGMQQHLLSQFTESVKSMKDNPFKLSRIQNLLRVEFGQNVQRCNEVKTMKKLMDRSKSVCQVRINGGPVGSGFLLFGQYVLTNAHVIKDIYNENRKLDEKVSVHFSYESVEQPDEGIIVEEVVCFEYQPDVCQSDFAVLKVSGHQELPVGLLKHLGFPPQDGGVCIIGHPDGGVKKIDPCLIVPSQNRNQVVERHYRENQGPVQFVTGSFFQDVAECVQQKVLTYGTSFYHGSSGSPVFDKYCNVVAVHTAGYAYCRPTGVLDSVIEYGHPLSDLLVRLVIQVVQRKKFDVLKEYLAFSDNRHEVIKNNVKKLVESRNDTIFKEAINTLVHTDDMSLKEFWGFFSQTEEPVPMEF